MTAPPTPCPSCCESPGATSMRDLLRAENDRLLRLLAVERATVEQVMETQRSERGLLLANIAALTADLHRDMTIAEEKRDDLRVALGLPPGTTSTWERLLEMVEKHWRQLAAVREASR